MYKTYFLHNWLPRWNQILTQLRFLHNWVITGIQWMVRWWVLVHCGQAKHLFQECPTPWPLPYSINLISGGFVPIICKTQLKNPFLSFLHPFPYFFPHLHEELANFFTGFIRRWMTVVILLVLSFSFSHTQPVGHQSFRAYEVLLPHDYMSFIRSWVSSFISILHLSFDFINFVRLYSKNIFSFKDG